MTYEIYARKYRPKTFEDLIGQESIADTLRHAVEKDRTAGVYVFSGLHGIGKTSAARIFAKALNCRRAKKGSPCGTCRICKSIARGGCIDVVEIDAASNSRVDDIRDLRDSLAYRPAECRFKVFILDEAHRLSTAAFDALLKVFEESIDTTRFILATTELHKLPSTILSRSQTFRFRPASMQDVMRALDRIKLGEGLSITKAALRSVAHRAAGSLRDAQKYLDQVVALAPTDRAIKSSDVAFLFGEASQEIVKKCLAGFASQNPGQVLEAVQAHISEGGRSDALGLDISEAFRGALYLRTCGSKTSLLDDLLLPKEVIEPLLDKFTATELLDVLDHLQEMQLKLRSVRDPRLLLEVTLAKIAAGSVYNRARVVEQAPAAEEKKRDYAMPAEFEGG